MKHFFSIVGIFLFIALNNANAANLAATAPSANKADATYMQTAIDLAKHNPSAPFAAILVDDKTGKVLAEGLNDVAKTNNPLHHGEMNAMQAALKKNSHIDWQHVTLYTTAEPCAMCQSAVIWLGIHRVVFGTSSDNLELMGWQQIDVPAQILNNRSEFYHGTVLGGVLSDQTDALFKKK